MVSYSYGQGEVEANQFSRTDLNGTARAMSMGGAFGALGGDLTGVSINPAGIAVYRSSEIATTAVFQSEKFKAPNETNTKNSFNFHNLGFVGYFPTRNPVIPVVNFGFSYNKVKSFDRNIGVVGENRENSLMEYMKFQGEGYLYDELKYVEGKYDPFDTKGIPWLPAFGVSSNLIVPKNPNNPKSSSYNTIHSDRVTNDLYLSERGSIDVYDFTVGTSIANTLNLGLTLSVSDLFYDLSSRNTEEFNKSDLSGFDLINEIRTKGNGVGVKLGLIYRPINELRLGLSYQSPTWYSMTDVYYGIIDHNLEDYNNVLPGYAPDEIGTLDYRNDYDFKTPDKWTASAALVLGSNMIVSMDYELTNYGSMKYSEPSNGYGYSNSYYDLDNSYISEDFKATSTVRTGLEYRFTPQFSGRLGYAWMQNPYDSTFKKNGNAMTAGATTAFRMEGDANYITGGLGYRFNRNFYADLAVVYKTQDDELYAYPNVMNESGAGKFIDAAPYKLTNTSIKGLITVGYKF